MQQLKELRGRLRHVEGMAEARHGEAAAGCDDDPAAQTGGSVERPPGARRDAFCPREQGAIQIDGEETVGHAGSVYSASMPTRRFARGGALLNSARVLLPPAN